MKIKVGKKTKNILLERGTYCKFINEVSKIESFGDGRKIVERLLRSYDPKLFDEYDIIYFPSIKKYDLSFALRKKTIP